MTPPVVVGALLPDIDTTFGEHRKTLHNPPLAVFFYSYALGFDNLGWVWMGSISHDVLDVAGSTRGIALFYPVSDEEFGLPVGVSTDGRFAQWPTPCSSPSPSSPSGSSSSG